MQNQTNKHKSRAEMFAEETLCRNPRLIKSALRSRRIVVGIPKALAETRQGQIALVTAVDILTRLGPLAPNLDIDVPEDVLVLPRIPLLTCGQRLGESLLQFMHRMVTIQPDLPNRGCVRRSEHYDVGLFIGSTTTNATKPITIGSKKWLGVVNPKGQQEAIATNDGNPLGTILAASLGSAEAVKRLWLPVKDPKVAIEPLTRRTVVSALDFSVNAENPDNPDLPSTLELAHACIIGLGAIGSACNYVLGCLPELEMSLDLVDMDRIEPSNEERLFTSSYPEHDVGQTKVKHAADFIRKAHPKLHAYHYQMPYELYVNTARERLGYVWCALDNGQARRLLQTELASVLVNGGTNGARWMVSLHEFDRPENACLCDLYPQPVQHSADHITELPELLGLRPAQIRVFAAQSRRLDRMTILRAMRAKRDPALRQTIAGYAGLTLEQAIIRKCSEGTPNSALPAATIGFVSIMPAVFMVADIVRRHLYKWRLPETEPNVFQFDCYRSPESATVCNVLAAKNCFCQSERFRKAFQKRQQLRLRYLNQVFSSQAPSATTRSPFRQLRYNPLMAAQGRSRLAQHQSGQVRSSGPQTQCQPRKRRPLSGTLLWLVSLVLYLSGMLGSIWAVELFVRHEDKKAEALQPWRLVQLACRTEVGAWSWAKYSAVSALPVAAYPILMFTSTRLIKRARVLWHGQQIRAAASHRSRITTGVLTSFFTATGMPCVSIATVAFAIMSLRGLWVSSKGVSEQACCFVLLLLPIVLAVLFFVCSVAVAQTLYLTWDRCC